MRFLVAHRHHLKTFFSLFEEGVSREMFTKMFSMLTLEINIKKTTLSSRAKSQPYLIIRLLDYTPEKQRATQIGSRAHQFKVEDFFPNIEEVRVGALQHFSLRFDKLLSPALVHVRCLALVV